MKRINIDSLIWSIVLLALVILFFIITLKGELKNYIHPDIIKYLYCTILITFIMGAYMFNEALDGRGEMVVKKGYVLFLLPFIIYVIIKPSGLTESVAFNRGINFNFYNYQNKNYDNLLEKHNHEHGQGSLIIKNDKLIINNNNFFSTLKELDENPENYKDNTIVIQGFVLKENNSSDSFILGRMVISCCAADSEIIGINCESSKGLLLYDGQWVEVEGKFKVVRSKNQIPSIKVINIKTINEPTEKYLYRD